MIKILGLDICADTPIGNMFDELNVHRHVHAEPAAHCHTLYLVILSSRHDGYLTAGNNMIRGISGGQRKRVTTGATIRC